MLDKKKKKKKKKRSIHWWWLPLPKLCNHSIRVLLTTLSHLEGQTKLKALPALQQSSPPEFGENCGKWCSKYLWGQTWCVSLVAEIPGRKVLESGAQSTCGVRFLVCKFGCWNSSSSKWNFKKVTTITHPVYDNKDCRTSQGQVTYLVR